MDSLLQNSLQGNLDSHLALDPILITTFNKINDPNSVVRESEYARTSEGLSLSNRFKGSFEKLKKGGSGLTDEDRKSLVQGAKIIANSQGEIFNQTHNRFSAIASKYNLDPDVVTGGLLPFKAYTTDSLRNTATLGMSDEAKQKYNSLKSKFGLI